jgi:hypothetical protein
MGIYLVKVQITAHTLIPRLKEAGGSIDLTLVPVHCGVTAFTGQSQKGGSRADEVLE